MTAILLLAALWASREALHRGGTPGEAPSRPGAPFPVEEPFESGGRRERVIAVLPVSFGRVVHVADGDTITLEGGKIVRYLGVDTPEHGEAYYEEAKAENLRLVTGKDVELKAGGPDPTDRYGRILALVFLKGRSENGDSLWVNLHLLEKGLAVVYRESPDSIEEPTLEALLSAQRKALSEGMGMWPGRLSRARGEPLVATRLHIHRPTCPLLPGKPRPLITSLVEELGAGKSPCRTCRPLP